MSDFFLLSDKCRAIIASCRTLEQLSIAERYGRLVAAECERRNAPVTFNFAWELSVRRNLIELGAV